MSELSELYGSMFEHQMGVELVQVMVQAFACGHWARIMEGPIGSSLDAIYGKREQRPFPLNAAYLRWFGFSFCLSRSFGQIKLSERIPQRGLLCRIPPVSTLQAHLERYACLRL